MENNSTERKLNVKRSIRSRRHGQEGYSGRQTLLSEDHKRKDLQGGFESLEIQKSKSKLMSKKEFALFAVGVFRPQDSTKPEAPNELQILCVSPERGAVFVPILNIGPTLPPFFMTYAETRKNQWHYELNNPKINTVLASRASLANPHDLVRVFKNQNQNLNIDLGFLTKGK